MKKTIYNIRPEVNSDSAVKVSYSQFNMYKSCPLQWKLNYVDGYKISEPSIHTTFGTAMHNTIQLFLDTMYNKSVKAANNIGLQSLFKDFLVEEYATQKTNNNNTHFSNPKELNDFYYDGINILDYFLKKRSAYFSSRNCKLIGIEIPVQVETDTNHNVLFNGFLDLVLDYIKDIFLNYMDMMKIKLILNISLLNASYMKILIFLKSVYNYTNRHMVLYL
jgi:hypothetical protein